MDKLGFSKISTVLLIATLLFVTPVMAFWVYFDSIEGPVEDTDNSIHVVMNQFLYDDPGSVLPGGPGTIVTTPEETTPEVPPEEPGGSTPEETTPTPPTPSEPEVEDGENHYNLLAFIIGDIGQEGLNISGGIINRFIDKTAGPEYSQDNTSAGGNLPKEFAVFNAENLQFILTFDKKSNPRICYAYTYETLPQYDNDELMGTYLVVYKTLIEPVGTNGRWVATRAYKGYAVLGDPSNKKVTCAPLIENWTQGEIPE